MISLFNPSDNTEIINRINNLKADSRALWGKMQVHQMLAHLQQPLKVAFGELKPKRDFMGFIFGGFVKKRLTVNENPIQKFLPTSKSFLIQNHPKFQEEKTKLIALVKLFVEKGRDTITNNPHPFFGKMTVEEWDTIMAKHLDHHLRQFGV